jgi:sec-independent protein translocase protein TatB
MFNLGGGEILVILLLALIVLGPQRLPEAARKVGNVVGEVRRMATGFQSEIKAAFDEVDLTPGSTPTTSRERTPATPVAPVTPPTPAPPAAPMPPPPQDEMPAAPAVAEDNPAPAPAPPPAPAMPDPEAPGRDDAVA